MKRVTLDERRFRSGTYFQLYHGLQALAKNGGECAERSGTAERPADINLSLSIIALTAARFALLRSVLRLLP